MSAPAAQGPNGRLPAASAAAWAPRLRAATGPGDVRASVRPTRQLWSVRTRRPRPVAQCACVEPSALRTARARRSALLSLSARAPRGALSGLVRVRAAYSCSLVALRPPVARAFVPLRKRGPCTPPEGCPALARRRWEAGVGGWTDPSTLAGTVPWCQGAG